MKSRFNFPYTDRQRELVEHPARILWIGTGTKTGKSQASYCWLVEGLLNGEASCFVGPWFFRSMRAFTETKILLEPWIRARHVRVNEARLQLVCGNAYLDFLSADNPNCLYGGNYDRLVLDESTRMPEAIHGAALTVVSATNGKLRCLFNLELGSKNWSVRNLLRVQRLSPEERKTSGEDFMCFPTDPALVDPALVETLRKQMPEQLWRALYLAEIPDSDVGLFQNLGKIFVGRELEKPIEGSQYFLAADVARKKDWSVITVIDDHGNVVAMDRFNQISWSLQVERARLLYRTFNCRRAIMDATGIGDAIAEEFEKAGMEVEPFIFTVPSRRQLIEELVMACDNTEITLPGTGRFAVYRSELESMEYALDGPSVRYAVPSGSHDDALFSLALAVHVFRQSRGAILSWIDYLQRMARDFHDGVRDAFGELLVPKPVLVKPLPAPKIDKPIVARVDPFTVWQQTSKAPPCPAPACGSTATVYNELKQIRCNQCGQVNGQPVSVVDRPNGISRGAYMRGLHRHGRGRFL